ncbi:MAG: glycerophosphodiester phosphodiesterase family protein [Halanaerobiales bacterium]|nr:glycerophosphodiester phosphodiesterase family protein [Halanaerobiales bacterium]
MTLIIFLVVVIIFFVFYGGYYFIRPSNKGKEILGKYDIKYPAVIAHRGASFKAPELTRPAFLKAIELGADYLEVDVHRTKDNILVALHDNNLKRTSNIEKIYPNRINHHINTFTYEELLKLDFGSWFNKKYSKRASDDYNNLKIITLSEILDIIDNHENSPGIVLDLKDTNKYPGLTEDIIELLTKKNWYGSNENENNKIYYSDIIIFSTDLEILKEFKNSVTNIPRLLLVTDNRMSKSSWKRLLDLAKRNVNGIGVKGFISWPWNIALAHERDLFVFPYVINKGWQFRIMAHLNSSGYITDRPELILDFLNRIPKIELFLE